MLTTQRRLNPDGTWNEPTGDSTGRPANLVLLFGGASALTDSHVLGAVRHEHPGAAIVGCTTAGEICGTSVHDGGAVATAIRFDHSAVRVAARDVGGAAHSLRAGRLIASEFPVTGLSHVLVFAEGLGINGSELVKGLREGLPTAVSVTGGLAADGNRFGNTFVCAGSTAREGMIAAVALYGSRLRVGYGSVGGWEQFGPERVVTKSDQNVVYEIDGDSALRLYRTYLGAHALDLPASGLNFPLSLRGAPGEPRLVRTILGVDDATGSLRFAGDIPEGTHVQLMKASGDRLIAGAHHAAVAAAMPHGEPGVDLALLISCVGRRLVLGQRVEEEVEAVAGVLGDSTALCGFYSHGEIAPFASSVKCELHNQTMTITTLSER